MADKIKWLGRPTIPGEIIEEDILRELKISRRRFATDIGVSEDFLNRLIDGRERIDTDLAERIATFLGTTSQFWLNLQNAVDEWDEGNDSSY